MSTHNIALPTIPEDEGILESMLADTQQRLFELRKQKVEKAAVASRAERLANLKDQLEIDIAALVALEQEQLPAGFALLQEAVAERFAATNGRSNSVEYNAKVNDTTARLIRQLEDVHRRKRNLDKQRKDISDLQSQVDYDIARAENVEKE